jgi:hypothetical protein
MEITIHPLLAEVLLKRIVQLQQEANDCGNMALTSRRHLLFEMENLIKNSVPRTP